MTQTRFKKVPFDLELAKKITNKEIKGRIISQAGHQARIICFDKDGGQSDYPIVALIQIEPTDERMYTFSKEGAYSIGNEFCRDLMIEVPTYYRDYSNFKPCKWQPCLVRDTASDLWRVEVCRDTDSYGVPIFYSANNSNCYCYWGYFIPLSKVTERLVGTKKSYEELIKELDKNGQD